MTRSAVPRASRKPAGSAHLIESFLDMMSAERGAGANTLAAYRRDLLGFAESLKGPDPARAGRMFAYYSYFGRARAGVRAE